MIDALILAVGAGLGLGILSAISWALLKHPHLPMVERIGLGLLGAGVVWGGLNRAADRPVDLGDLIFLAGVVLILWRYLGVNPKIEGVK